MFESLGLRLMLLLPPLLLLQASDNLRCCDCFTTDLQLIYY